jgi:MtN3 and saliva related transmembrane protein
MDENTLGLIAGTLTSIASVPQVIKVFKTKNTDDLSALMLVILISGLSLWVWYGLKKEELPIIISNAFAAILNIILLFCKLTFKK